jgi:hypothetical protein
MILSLASQITPLQLMLVWLEIGLGLEGFSMAQAKGDKSVQRR